MALDLIITWIMSSLALWIVCNQHTVTIDALGLCILTVCKLNGLLLQLVEWLCEVAMVKESLQRVHGFYTKFESEVVKSPVAFPARVAYEDVIEFNQAVIRGCA